MLRTLLWAATLTAAGPAAAQGPFPGPVRVAASKTHLEHADGTPFFFLADTCWTGPALSSAADWAGYLADRKAKGFTAVQFNMASPWRTAPADAAGNRSCTVEGDKLVINEAFYARLDARFDAILAAGLLPVPVLTWAHQKGDTGTDLSEDHVTELVRYELARYGQKPALWILAGDNNYTPANAAKWKRIGRKVFAEFPGLVVTTHPTGENFPWADWAGEPWLSVLGYQSGHGDSAKSIQWLTSGPPAGYGKQAAFARPVINLEPPYEAHNGYASRKPHSPLSARRCLYWSLLVHPPAGVTYGGHGVWSWHTKPGEHPTGHQGTGPAMSWKDALNLPAAGQVRHLRAAFERVPWPELRPAQELLTAQPGDADPAKFTACAATADRSALVVYTPAGAAGLAGIDPAVLGGKPLTVTDPATGKSVATTADRLAADAATVVGPDGDLVLTAGGRK